VRLIAAVTFRTGGYLVRVHGVIGLICLERN
jgi:hypothetical protein